MARGLAHSFKFVSGHFGTLGDQLFATPRYPKQMLAEIGG